MRGDEDRGSKEIERCFFSNPRKWQEMTFSGLDATSNNRKSDRKSLDSEAGTKPALYVFNKHAAWLWSQILTTQTLTAASVTRTSCTHWPNLLETEAAKGEGKNTRKLRGQISANGSERECKRHLHPSGTVDETVNLSERHHTPALLREKGEAGRETESARHLNVTTRKVEFRVGS